MYTLRYIWGQYASPLMLLLLLVAVVVGVAVGVGLARVRARRGKAPLSRGTYLVGVLLWLWLVGMVCVTLLGSRGIWGSGEVNLQLFLAWEEAWYAGDRTAWLYIVLNLALFLPLGVLLPLLETRFQKVTWVLGTAAVLSLAVEMLQFVLRRGSADIDDWFLNVLGAFLGWCLLRFVLGLKKREKKAVGYLLPPVACALVFCGIALAYQAQPYGMLPMQSVERVEMSGVEVHTDCPLPDVGETAPVYYAAPWTEANCDEYARPLLTALGEDFDAMEAERSEYRVDYTDPVHHSSLQVLFLGGFRALYQNQSGATEPAPATASREEVLQKLRSLGIPLPDQADFSTEAGAYWAWDNLRPDEDRLLHGSGGLLLHGGWGRGWRAVSGASHLYLPGRWTDPVSQRRACCGTAKRRGFHLPPGEGRGTGSRREVFGYRRQTQRREKRGGGWCRPVGHRYPDDPEDHAGLFAGYEGLLSARLRRKNRQRHPLYVGNAIKQKGKIRPLPGL